ncbi:MAG: hypothetical protein OEV52_02735 [Dehalococcoidia bacterium]|nr:hypothetical protein [Dehalococcoidia bacterium]
MERWHRAENVYHARDSVGEWVRYCNEQWLHSALKYLRLLDYHGGNLEALVAEKKRELTEAGARWKQVNKWGHLTGAQTQLYRFSTIDLSEND